GIDAAPANIPYDRSVIASCPCGVALVSQRDRELLDEFILGCAARQIVGVPYPAPDLAAVDHDVVIGRMRKHQVGGLADGVENALLEDVEARMQVQSMRLDAHLARHLDRGAAADHGIGEDTRMQNLEDLAVNVARAVTAIAGVAPRSPVRKGKDAAAGR